MFNYEEKLYKSNLEVRYVLVNGKYNREHLVIVFSGFNPPHEDKQHSYNYIKSLEGIDCNKLFILDSFGHRGCYYLGENMDLVFETSVMSLITHISRKLNVGWQEIIMVGSSKGGSAALYLGLKYNVTYIISGVPQIQIANFLIEENIDTAKYILGQQIEVKNINTLNSIIFNQLHKEIFSRIYLLTSENDSQFNSHIVPFINVLKERNIIFNLTINNDMKCHDEIDKFFPTYLIKNIFKIIFGIEIIKCRIINVINIML